MSESNRFHLAEALGAPRADWLKRLAQFGKSVSAQWWMTGGAVRDILLGVNIGDLDLVTDAEISLVLPDLKTRWKEFFPEYPAPQKIIQFRKYRTAKLRFAPQIFNTQEYLDFASTRAEEYSTPGSPPVTRRGTLEEDLFRRDFSINAMAFSIDSELRGELIDRFDGEADLARKQIRVLHPKSFLDDPMRIVRAARFLSRMAFQLEPQTEQLLREAIRAGVVQNVTRERRASEMKKLRNEATAEIALHLLQDWGIASELTDESSNGD